MSISSFVKSQAKKVGEAIEFKAKATKVHRQVQSIIEAVGNDQRVDLSYEALDHDLYDELESMGLIEKARKAGILQERRKNVQTVRKWDDYADDNVIKDDGDDHDEGEKSEKEIVDQYSGELQEIGQKIERLEAALMDGDLDQELEAEWIAEKKELSAKRIALMLAQSRDAVKKAPAQEAPHKKAKLTGQKNTGDTQRKPMRLLATPRQRTNE